MSLKDARKPSTTAKPAAELAAAARGLGAPLKRFQVYITPDEHQRFMAVRWDASRPSAEGVPATHRGRALVQLYLEDEDFARRVDERAAELAGR